VLLAISASVVVVVVLLWDVGWPILAERIARWRAARARIEVEGYDPGRERRAEQRARTLLRSCVNEEEWAMYRDLGFVRVWGALADGPLRDRDRGDRGNRGDRDRANPAGTDPAAGTDSDRANPAAGAPYAYLIYPHKPIVAYLPQTRRLLSEYCVTFPDETRPYGSARLPDSDDVLAKWMALTGDERRIIASANMHLPGRQVDPKQVRRDLWRLGQWEQQRLRDQRSGAGSVPAP
jgi:hypothetical protein